MIKEVIFGIILKTSEMGKPGASCVMPRSGAVAAVLARSVVEQAV